MDRKVLRPLADRVLVRVNGAEDDHLHKVLHLPDYNQDEPQCGTVMAVGKGQGDRFVDVKTGDSVLFGRETGIKINVEGIEGLLLKESEIYAVIETKRTLKLNE